MARLHVWSEARPDFQPLTAAAREAALGHLKKAMKHPNYGVPLDYRIGQDLRGCFKIYFSAHDDPSLANPTGPRKMTEGGASYRIVYLYNQELDRIEVLAAGSKPGVYQDASDRKERGDGG